MEHSPHFQSDSRPRYLYLHEAMREPDRDKFLQAMLQEADSQLKNGNFTFVKRSQVPQGQTILPAVWALKRKWDIRTQEIKIWKARLNIDGSKMKKGQHYDLAYAPVASWSSIRLILAIAEANGWRSRQLDYVQAFPQAPVEKEIYMKIPKGMETEYVLGLNRNMYGQKQAGRVWNQYLVQKLRRIGFKPSKVDECILYKGSIIYISYTDDSILMGPDLIEIDNTIKLMKEEGLDLTVEGDLQDFLEVHISRTKEGHISYTQPHLIDNILKELRLDDDQVTMEKIPLASTRLLSRHTGSPAFDEHFNYRPIIGKLG